MYVGVPDSEHRANWSPLQDRGYVPRTLTSFGGGWGERNSAVYWKPVRPFTTKVWNSGYVQPAYEGDLSPSYFQVDVRLGRRDLPPPVKWREKHAKTVAEANKELTPEGKPLAALVRRALAYFALEEVAVGFDDFVRLNQGEGLDALREHPGYLQLLREAGLDRWYSGIWHDSPTQESAESHGLSPTDHLARCRQLAAEGYRPASLCVAEVEAGRPLVTASVWHRPVVAARDRSAWARQQANVATALLQLGEADRVWPLLRHRPDPELRSHLIRNQAAFATDPGLLVRRLQEEPDVSARRALILSLGEFDGQHLPAEMRHRLLPRLLRWYRDDPDPGIHAVVDAVVKVVDPPRSIRPQGVLHFLTHLGKGGRHRQVAGLEFRVAVVQVVAPAVQEQDVALAWHLHLLKPGAEVPDLERRQQHASHPGLPVRRVEQRHRDADQRPVPWYSGYKGG